MPSWKMKANWVLNELTSEMNKAKLSWDECPIPPNELVSLLSAVSQGMITRAKAKQIQHGYFVK